jgi:hypothetical protein
MFYWVHAEAQQQLTSRAASSSASSSSGSTIGSAAAAQSGSDRMVACVTACTDATAVPPETQDSKCNSSTHFLMHVKHATSDCEHQLCQDQTYLPQLHHQQAPLQVRGLQLRPHRQKHPPVERQHGQPTAGTCWLTYLPPLPLHTGQLSCQTLQVRHWPEKAKLGAALP